MQEEFLRFVKERMLETPLFRGNCKWKTNESGKKQLTFTSWIKVEQIPVRLEICLKTREYYKGFWVYKTEAVRITCEELSIFDQQIDLREDEIERKFEICFKVYYGEEPVAARKEQVIITPY